MWSIAGRLVLLALIAGACDVPYLPVSPGGLEAELSLCVDEVNRHRATVGQSPLARSPALEDIAAKAAEVDGLAHVAHRHFRLTQGSGLARAETEISWWRGSRVSPVIRSGLARMWQAGPKGEHYPILAGPYSEIGCGVFINGREITVVQDFR